MGVMRMTSLVRERYQVALMSAFSPQKPTSKPPSSSFVRSGRRSSAGFVAVYSLLSRWLLRKQEA